MPRAVAYGLILVAFVSTVLGRSFTVLSTGTHDAMLFAYMGEMWQRGYTLYVDLWDIKPPGIFVINAIAFAILPDPFAGIAVIEGIAILSAIFFTYQILRLFRIDTWSLVFGVCSVSILINLYFFNSGGNFTEIYVLPFALGSMLFFITGFIGAWSPGFLLAGLFAGLASLFKLTGISPYLAQICFLAFLLMAYQQPWRGLFKVALFLTGGLVAPWLIAAAYFAPDQALYELFHVSFIYPFIYGSSSLKGLLPSLSLFFSRLGTMYYVAVFAAIGLMVVAKHLPRRQYDPSDTQFMAVTKDNALFPFGLLVALWVAGDLAGSIAGGRFYAHYFLTSVPSLSVMASLALSRLFGPAAIWAGVSSAGRGLLIVLLLFPLAASQAQDWKRFGQAIFSPPDTENSWTCVADAINVRRQQSDLLFVYDYKPVIYFRTKLLAASRHSTAINVHDSPQSSVQIGDRILEDLESRQPRFIVVSDAVVESSEPASRFTDDFIEFVKKDYLTIDDCEGVGLYERSR